MPASEPAMVTAEMCQCGCPRSEHAGRTERGVCSVCYGVSNHGLNMYCHRYRRRMVTAETITDEQIRELLEDPRHRSSAIVALTPPGSFERDEARARCAVAWNARHGGGR